MVKEVLAGIGGAIGTAALSLGVVAGLGAASGAIGASIFNSTNPDWSDITTSEFVNAMMVGELILSALPVCCFSVLGGIGAASAVSSDSEVVVKTSSTSGLITHAASGAITGMLGGAVQGLFDNAATKSADIGFTAAAGAVGSLLAGVGAGIAVACCVVPCAVVVASSDAADIDLENSKPTATDLTDIPLNTHSENSQSGMGSMIYNFGSRIRNMITGPEVVTENKGPAPSL